MLKVDAVSSGYGDLIILRRVTMEVLPGTVTVLIGPNGAGKTTLLRTIMGLLRPRQDDGPGTIAWRGRRIDALPTDEIARLGLAVSPEGARVFPDLSVEENLLVGSTTSRARARRAAKMAEVFSLFPRLAARQQPARTLSGGERQMLSIGRALMSCPELLLLDEPSLGLQPTLVRAIMEAIREIQRQGITVLLIEQNVHVALSLAGHAYVMEHGRIVLEGTGEELLGNPHVRLSYLGM